MRARAMDGREGMAVCAARPAAPALDRVTGLLPALILAVLMLWAFRGPLTGRVFYLRDISQNHRPVRMLVTERLQRGELPLWNPYHGAGTPLLANPNHLVLHPISLLFLVLPFEAAFTASILLQHGLLVLGGWLLLRRTGAPPAGATLGAAMLALSGPAASLASMQNVLSAAAWVPIGLWALVRGLEPGGRRFLPLAAGALGVVLIAAEPASALAFLLIGTVFTVRPPPGRAPAPGAGHRLLRAAAVAFVGGLIGAAQIVPARALLPIATRGAGFEAAEGLKWSLAPARLLELVLPQIFGDPTRLSPGAWWGHWLFEGGYPFLMVAYLGAAPCLLAVLALLSRPRPSWSRGLGVVALLGLVLALGSHSVVYRGLFESWAPVRQVRYPERFLLVTLFALAILAAHGLGRLQRGGGARLTGTLVAVAAAAFAVVSLVAAAPWLVDAVLGTAARIPGAVLAVTAPVLRGAAMRALLWMFVQLSLVAAVAVLARRAGTASLRVEGAAWALTAAAGISMAVAAQPALSSADRGWLADPSPLAPRVAHGPGGPRLHHEPRPPGVSVWGQSDETIWGYRFDRFSYSLATGHADGVATVLDPATDRMDLAAQAGLGAALRSLTIGDRLRILKICGAGFLLTHDERAHPDLIPGPALDGFSRPPLRLYAIQEFLPRVRFRTRALAPEAPGNLVGSLLDPDYDPRRMVMLHDAPDLPTAGTADAASGADDAGGDVVLIEDRPERIRIRARADRPGWVVIGDAHAPGWSARVDGAPAPLLRADGLFRAVPVGVGNHEVVMTYTAPGVHAGLVTGLAGLLLAVGWAAAPAWRPRRDS